MKLLTFRLGQFAISALLITVLFRYALSLSIGVESALASALCSVMYFCLMFLVGWYFGKKEDEENGIYDIGFRFHLVTYIICVGVGYASYYIDLNTENIRAMTISTICWGIGLLVHLIFFVIAKKRTIKGYVKEDIFE